MFVHAGVAWKALLQEKTSRAVPVSTASGLSANNLADRRASENRKSSAHLEYDPTPVLVAQRNDIIRLWKNAEVQEILKRRRPWLNGSSGLCVAYCLLILEPILIRNIQLYGRHRKDHNHEVLTHRL